MAGCPIQYSKNVLNQTEIQGVELAFAIAAYKANQEGRLDSAVNGMDAVSNMEPGIPKMMLTKKHQMSLIGEVIGKYSSTERYVSDVAKRHSQKSQNALGVEIKRRPTSIENSLSKLSEFVANLKSEKEKLRAEFLEPFLPSAGIFKEKFDAAKSLDSDFAMLELELKEKMPELKEAMNELSDNFSLPTALAAAKAELEMRKSLVVCFEHSTNCFKEVDALKSEMMRAFPGGLAEYYKYPHSYSLDIEVKDKERRLGYLKEDCQRIEAQVAMLEAQISTNLAKETNAVCAPVLQIVTPANRKTFMDRFNDLFKPKPFHAGSRTTQHTLSTR